MTKQFAEAMIDSMAEQAAAFGRRATEFPIRRTTVKLMMSAVNACLQRMSSL
ncbi:hypothetical protein PV762_25830 [Mitsuaria sp. CC2]|uniref:hypothetical protein n=1 Tax=Mitsuaria sp. CC2 TaxID=3029186 RepID=UPI003B8AB22A